MPSARRAISGLTLWGPVVLYLGGITWLSHQPGLRPPANLPDWLLHGAEYGGLAALLARALRGTRGAFGSMAAAMAAAGCLAFAVLDEYHQSFVPGRDASLRDVAADSVGAALALAAAVLLAGFRAGRDPGTVEIRLLGRGGCHLCEEAERVLKEVSRGYAVRLEKIDIDQDPELSRRYGEQVPVVMINGRKSFKLRVDPERLRRKLASLQQRRTS